MARISDVVPLVRSTFADIQGLPSDKRCEAATGLVEETDPVARLVLLYMADDRCWQVRESVAAALARAGGPLARIVARALIGDPVALVRSTAARTLGRHGNRQDVPRLVRALGDADFTVRCDAATGLARLGGAKSRLALMHALVGEPHPAVRRDIAYALAEVGGPTARACIEEALARETSNLARAGLLFGLYRLGEGNRLVELLDLLHDDDPLVRANVVNGITAEALLPDDVDLVTAALSALLAREPDRGVRADAVDLQAKLTSVS